MNINQQKFSHASCNKNVTRFLQLRNTIEKIHKCVHTDIHESMYIHTLYTHCSTLIDQCRVLHIQ